MGNAHAGAIYCMYIGPQQFFFLYSRRAYIIFGRNGIKIKVENLSILFLYRLPTFQNHSELLKNHKISIILTTISTCINETAIHWIVLIRFGLKMLK